MSRLNKVLTLQNYYLPGHRGGGPIRAISNMIAALDGDAGFWVVTNDRDLGVNDPYPMVPRGQWTSVGPANVLYIDPLHSLGTIWRLLRGFDHDILYLNSVFERRYSLWPLLLRRFGLIRDRLTILAPRGELGRNALAIKGGRKRALLAAAMRIGLYDNLVWHATSHTEVADIARFLEQYRCPGRIFQADDIVDTEKHTPPLAAPKAPGHARLIYLSRIVPKKNLLFALSVLRQVHSRVTFDIYGPREDQRYWARCESAIAALPPNITVNYCGVLPHDRVLDTFGQYDLFFFPTLNENFGYAVFEALKAGCPVLLSNETPWEEAAKCGAGWILPLGDARPFADRIEEVAKRGDVAQRAQSALAREYAARVSADPSAVSGHRDLFHLVEAG